MSKQVDERVVEMQFDNKDFEKNVATTMSTLDKFKQKLNFDGATKGLDAINNKANNINMNGMANAIENVRSKFSALEIIGITALANITNSAVNAGKRIVSALTIDPVKTGFDEYETKINAIQTIMSNTANKGTTMSDVTDTLNKLNLYADKTIYNFAQMTKNIGTFTAAGVGLKESAEAIQGIANLAAASGSNADQASSAMYQLSQALASGTVKLMDWNSVVNAGMGGQKFQEALKSTAREHGVAIDKIIKNEGSFRDSLQEGWLTADILNETLSKFTVDGAKKYAEAMLKSKKYTQAQADALIKESQAMEDAATKVKTFTQLWSTLKEAAQSGWAQTWELIIGNFDEAKTVMTELSDTFGELIAKSAESRNNLFSGWKDLGGRKDIIDSLENSFKALSSILSPIGKAFREVFPATTVEQLKGFTEGLKEFTSKLIISDTTAEKLHSTFKGVFSIISIGINFISNLTKETYNVVKSLLGFSGSILDVTSKLGEFSTSLKDSVKSSDIFSKIFSTISKILIKFINSINVFGRRSLSIIGDSFVKVAKIFGDAIKEIFNSFGEALNSGSIDKIMNIINKGLIAAVLLKLKNFIHFIGKGGTLFDTINRFIDNVGGIATSISGIFNTVKDSLVAWQQNLQAGTLLKIATAIGILALSLVALSGIDEKALKNALSAITTLFIDLVFSLMLLTSKSISGATATMGMVISLAIAVSILAGALKKIADLNPGELVKGVLAISILCTVMAATSKLMATNSKAAIRGAVGLIAFAASIKILALAVKDLGSISWRELIKGLGGVITLLGAVALFTKVAKMDSKMITLALGLVVLGGAIKILVSSVKELGDMNVKQLTKGIGSIYAILTAFTLFSRFNSSSKNIIASSLAFTIIAFSLKQIVPVFKSLSEISAGGLIKSALTITAVMAILVGSMKLLSGKGGIKSSISTLMTAGSLDMMVNMLSKIANALIKFKDIQVEDLAKGIISIALSLGTLVLATKLMKTSDEWPIIMAAVALLTLAEAVSILSGIGLAGLALGLGGISGVLIVLGVGTKLIKPLIPTMFKLAGAIATLSGSLLLLSVSIFAMGIGLTTILTGLIAAFIGFKAVNWEDMAKGLVTLAATFVIMGVAAKVLGSMTLSILGLSASLFMFGISVAAFGLGISLLISGFVALSAISKEGSQAAAYALTNMAYAILAIIPIAVVEIGKGIVEFMKVLTNMMPQIGNFLVASIAMLVDVLVQSAPDIAKGFYELILNSLKLLAEYAPEIVNTLFDFLVKTIETLTSRVPELVTVFFKFAGVLFDAIANSFNNLDTTNLIKAITAIGLMSILTYALAGIVSSIPMAMVGLAGLGVMVAETALIIAAIGGLSKIEGLSSLIEQGGNFLQVIGTAIGQFVGGIIGGIGSGVSNSLPDIGTNLSQFMTNLSPFIEGLKQLNPGTLSVVSELTTAIASLTASSLLNNINSFLNGGNNSFADFGTGLSNLGIGINKFIINLGSFGQDQVNTIFSACYALRALSDMSSSIPNSGGLFSWFSGNNDIDTFASKLPIIGTALNSLIINLSSFGQDKVNTIFSVCYSLKALSDMANSIPNSGGLFSWFSGNNNLDTFASTFPIVGKSLNDFIVKIGTFGQDQLNIVYAAVAAMNALSNFSSIDSGKIGSTLVGLSNDLPIFGTAMSSFVSGISTVSADGINESINKMNTIIEMAKNITTINMASLNAFGTSLKDIGKKAMDGFIGSLTGDEPKAMAYKGITELLTSILNGIEDKRTELIEKFKSVVNSALDTIQSQEFTDKAMTAGMYFAQGFANGINDNKYLVTIAGSDLGNAAYDAAAKAIDSHSPSKRTYKLGGFYVQGFVNGIAAYGSKVYDQSYDMGTNATDGLSKGISYMNDLLSVTMDNGLTLRPVLDLSDIESGSSKIGKMFNDVNFGANLSAISSNMNKKNQNGINDDVISAIDKLRSSINKKSGDTYNLNGITYGADGEIADAISTLIRAANIERRS